MMVKLSVILLAVLSFMLAAVHYFSLPQGMLTKHGGIIMITIAAYTFYKATMAIIRAVKQHKNHSPLLKTLRCITYAEVAASLLTLQRSMLVSFGTRNGRQISLMNAVTGAAVCLFVLGLGISMTVKSAGKENK